MQNQQID